LIRPPSVVEEVVTEETDAGELESFSSGALVNGVLASSITLNAMQPFQEHPERWDVFSTPLSIVDDRLEALALPDPSFTIAEYVSPAYGDEETVEPDDPDGGEVSPVGPGGLEFDEACMLSPELPTRQRLPNGGQHNSYVLQAR